MPGHCTHSTIPSFISFEGMPMLAVSITLDFNRFIIQTVQYVAQRCTCGTLAILLKSNHKMKLNIKEKQFETILNIEWTIREKMPVI